MTGLFPDRASAERAYNALGERGYSHDEVNVAMSDDTRKKHFTPASTETELGNKAAEGEGVGGAIGGTLGAIAAAVAAVGTSLVLPGFGLARIMGLDAASHTAAESLALFLPPLPSVRYGLTKWPAISRRSRPIESSRGAHRCAQPLPRPGPLRHDAADKT